MGGGDDDSDMFEEEACVFWDIELLSRKSCVTAIPIDANASEVRSQARNVRSIENNFFFFNQNLKLRPSN